jgi:ribose-phosphate pyrophosphokinase
MNSKSYQDRGHLSIMACGSGKVFAERIVERINKIAQEEDSRYSEPISLTESEEITFANGEIKHIIHKNIRGDDLYIVQCIDDPNSDKSVNDNLIALLTAVDAAYHSDPDFINVVIPQFPYSRQERRKAREGITAKLVTSFLERSGANRVITLDIHAEAIGGFFSTAKLENLHASRQIIRYFRQRYPQFFCNDIEDPGVNDLIVASPDMGSAERGRFFADRFKTELALLDKVRNYQKLGRIEAMRLVGNVRDKNIFIADDMISTGGTLLHACRELKRNGAKDIFIATSLPFFNGNAIEKFDQAFHDGIFRTVIGTDAVMRGEKFCQEHPWYEEISVAPLFADVIYLINHKRSVSEHLK